MANWFGFRQSMGLLCRIARLCAAYCLVLPIGLAGYKGYLKILFSCRGIEFGQFLLHPDAGGIGSIGHGFGFAEVGHGGQGTQEGVDVLRA